MLEPGDRRQGSSMLPVSDGIRARRFPIVNVAIIVANFAVWLLYELPHLDAAVSHAPVYPCSVTGACHPPEPWALRWIAAIFLGELRDVRAVGARRRRGVRRSRRRLRLRLRRGEGPPGCGSDRTPGRHRVPRPGVSETVTEVSPVRSNRSRVRTARARHASRARASA